MKKIRFLPLVAFALAVAVSSFTSRPVSTKSLNTAMYWFADPQDGNSYQGSNTLLDEQGATGCDSNHAICEQGFTASQLVDPADPTKGVLSAQQANGSPIRQR